MPNDPTKPDTAAQITFERFTESTLSAVLRAASAHQLTHRPVIIGIVFNPAGGYGTTVTCGFAAVVKPERAKVDGGNASAEIDRLRKEVERAEKMLANERFVENAAPDVVEAEREKLAKYRRELDALSN